MGYGHGPMRNRADCLLVQRDQPAQLGDRLGQTPPLEAREQLAHADRRVLEVEPHLMQRSQDFVRRSSRRACMNVSGCCGCCASTPWVVSAVVRVARESDRSGCIATPRSILRARGLTNAPEQVPHGEMHQKISKQSRIEDAGIQKGDERTHSTHSRPSSW
jgi:hypothetical protein